MGLYSLCLGSGPVALPVAGHEPRYTLGRQAPADVVVLGNKAISRSHAVLEVKSGGMTITDTGSKFGTKVVKEPQQPQHGKHLRLYLSSFLTRQR